MSPQPATDLAAVFGALGDETRLKMVAFLARRPHYGEELAEYLGVRAATVSHHLRRLREAGLVESQRETPYIRYALRPDGLDAAKDFLASGVEAAARIGLPEEDELAEDIVAQWTDDEGQLREIPRGKRSRAVVLRWVAHHLDRSRLYPERELRLILLRLSHEPDTLRDELVRRGWLQRAGTVYRRIEEIEAP